MGTLSEFLLNSLCDFRDECLPMVLWGNFATDVSEAIERGGDNAIVCVLRFGKIKVWKCILSFNIVLFVYLD